jgi:hypothetical protein
MVRAEFGVLRVAVLKLALNCRNSERHVVQNSVNLVALMRGFGQKSSKWLELNEQVRIGSSITQLASNYYTCI